MIPGKYFETYGLVVEPIYGQLVALCEMFTPGIPYDTKQIFAMLEKKYRKSDMTNQVWYDKINKTLDACVKYDLLEMKDGYYWRTKKR